MAIAVPLYERYDPRTEGDRVIAWRLQCLLQAGYPPEEAELIATQTSVDLHCATELARRGCPPSVAARILL